MYFGLGVGLRVSSSTGKWSRNGKRVLHSTTMNTMDSTVRTNRFWRPGRGTDWSGDGMNGSVEIPTLVDILYKSNHFYVP